MVDNPITQAEHDTIMAALGEMQRARISAERVEAQQITVNLAWSIALYQEARDSYTKCIGYENEMKRIVIAARATYLRAERAREEVKADAIVNAEDEESGVFAHYRATNDRARRAAIEMWEASDPAYLDCLRARDQALRELQEAEADYVICIRTVAALRLDMTFAITLIAGKREIA